MYTLNLFIISKLYLTITKQTIQLEIITR